MTIAFRTLLRIAALSLAVFAQLVVAQSPTKPSTSFALVGGRVIVGDGSAAHDDWTIVVTSGRITAVGPRSKVKVPASVTIIDVRGKSVIPGLIDAHGHHYANTGGKIENVFEAYPLLYLAGGVTSVISPGDFDPAGMLDLKMRINRGETVGARIFMGGYYIDNTSARSTWFKPISNAGEAAQRVEAWKGRIDIVKFYVRITDDEMRAAIAVAKKHGIPTTAHLGDTPGSVNASRAIDLGVNGLEHGLPMAMRAFFDADSTLDEKAPCPIGDLDLDRPVVRALIDKIVRNKIAIDPTFVEAREGTAGFEPVTANRERFFADAYKRRSDGEEQSSVESERACTARTYAKTEEYIRRIWEKGGRILVGTDPVGPDLIPGYALHREMQILVHAGIPPLEVIKAASYNAAFAIRHDKDLGSIAVGKLADLVVVDGDPSVRIEDVGKTEIVFQAGVRYDPVGLRKNAEGKIGAATAAAAVARMLTTERSAASWALPAQLPGYRIGTDERVARTGTASGHITANGSASPGPAQLSQLIKTDELRGKRVRLSAYVRTSGLELSPRPPFVFGSGAALFMRVYNGDGATALATQANGSITWDIDWTKCEIVLDVPQNAIGVSFGLTLAGIGEVWIDDALFEIVGSDVPITGMLRNTPPNVALAQRQTELYRSAPLKPSNMGFEQMR